MAITPVDPSLDIIKQLIAQARGQNGPDFVQNAGLLVAPAQTDQYGNPLPPMFMEEGGPVPTLPQSPMLNTPELQDLTAQEGLAAQQQPGSVYNDAPPAQGLGPSGPMGGGGVLDATIPPNPPSGSGLNALDQARLYPGAPWMGSGADAAIDADQTDADMLYGIDPGAVPQDPSAMQGALDSITQLFGPQPSTPMPAQSDLTFGMPGIDPSTDPGAYGPMGSPSLAPGQPTPPGTLPAVPYQPGGAAAAGGASASGMPDTRAPEVFDPQTGLRDEQTRGMSIIERLFGEEGSDRRTNTGKALMAAGAAIMQSTGNLGQALGAGIQAGLVTYEEAAAALREEEQEMRRLNMDEEAHALDMELRTLQLARTRATPAPGSGGSGVGGSAGAAASLGLHPDIEEAMQIEANLRMLYPEMDPTMARSLGMSTAGVYQRGPDARAEDEPSALEALLAEQ